MQSHSNTLSCPQCGGAATITLSERVDERAHTEGHEITFSSVSGCPSPGEAELLVLWAAGRQSASGSNDA